jgi:hypothetical protein
MLDIKGFSELKVEKIKEAVAKCQVNQDLCQRSRLRAAAHIRCDSR